MQPSSPEEAQQPDRPMFSEAAVPAERPTQVGVTPERSTSDSSLVQAATPLIHQTIPTESRTVSVPQVTTNPTEVIDKKWVDKAETIIAQTADDPRAQKAAEQALSHDYLAREHGFDIKLS